MGAQSREIAALVVHQWLPQWDKVTFSPDEHRRKPDPFFYVFAAPAHLLRRLASVYRREERGPRALDTGIQRAHDIRRSEEIARYVHAGFPWSDLSDRQIESGKYADLLMPGWLPTAIVANILAPNTCRRGIPIADGDVMRIERTQDGMARIILPSDLDQPDWNPAVPPIEIIDGQHRLWAFAEKNLLGGDYELPVVAYYNLDITWQAYLFYTINIKPKRINASLAFDLYPLLRVQEWLERSPSGAAIYRETRAQELTEALWSHPSSPWRSRISMLGERRVGAVTQAAFIRSLMASYVKGWEGRGISVGGLFGARLQPGSADVLQWSRAQQAAFLILVWRTLADAVRDCHDEWAESLRRESQPVQISLPLEGRPTEMDPAFAGPHALLATDQGVRGVLQVTNDMSYVLASQLNLDQWQTDMVEDATLSDAAVTEALSSLQQQPAAPFLRCLADRLSQFDWRASSTPCLTEDERARQMVYRGGSGYKELRRRLVQHLMSASDEPTRLAADDVWKRLGY